ncbi:phosphoglucosamine mutase [Pseudomarimonas salicorniae]|uniref:Phosphoglucosamine mutase n=1 Tax=Pseudomarimonas salicorniae TaxID=2933270 RepID=A0ABT0GJF1_9GAMM|nr:phosphoglucosamine mutase [Lysobacter sp. CAU 1642]MCK7594679.1 phosphoglucosamine mutase [Lysobacter sp. CAU 1642]
MARRYFGTDGIRGRVGDGVINPEFMLRLGNALGRVLSAEGRPHPSVVIGKDTRISGYMFESALEAGLVAAGAHVRLLGPMPTPAVAQLTRSLRADAGIVISASHNPHEDNGIKLFSARGEKLDDATELAIEEALDSPLATRGSEHLGKASRIEDAAARYVEFCKASVPSDLSLHGLRIALDCAHGATYHVAPRVFRELGAEVDAIGVAPDGLNINREVGSTSPAALSRHVLASGADVGIAFDGDGDRVQMVDRLGNLVDGDALLYVLASAWKRSGRLKGPVVGTLMTNFGLEQALGVQGIEFRRVKVGDRYVHQALVAEGGILGGETSGHVLCLDRASTGDGIVAALQVMEVLAQRGLGLREALEGLHTVPQKTVNLKLAPGSKPLEAECVKRELAYAQSQLEGRGRVVLRPSGTEPVVRVTVEADDAAVMQQILDRLSEAVRAAA